jgi:diguanylate cyclase
MAGSASKTPWLVRMHHRMRTVSFAMVFGAASLHLSGKGYGAASWSYLVVLLLIYPHLQYWRSRRAADAIQAEMAHLKLDSVLLGALVAVVQFSDWLTFSVVMGTLSNNAANKGWRGIAESLLGLGLGVGLGLAVFGFGFSPQTDWPAMLVCMLGLGAYLLAMNNIGFSRNIQLRKVRKVLEGREKELLKANETMRRNLDEIDQLQARLQDQANRDSLTGLFNRRFLDVALNRELARCSRENKPLSLLMIDVDHFKKYNDRYGHPSGDECLRRVAQVLTTCAKRASDLAARYGGEEFVVVLPDTDAIMAQRLALEVLTGVASLTLMHDMSRLGRVSVSIGAATSSGDVYRDEDSLLRAADLALYRAKHCGRNQIQMAPEAAHKLGEDSLELLKTLRLEWDLAHECGHADIDDAHRDLFAHVNLVLERAVSGVSRSVVAEMADTLIAEMHRHFVEEEQIVEAAGFPQASQHALGVWAAEGKIPIANLRW